MWFIIGAAIITIGIASTVAYYCGGERERMRAKFVFDLLKAKCDGNPIYDCRQDQGKYRVTGLSVIHSFQSNPNDVRIHCTPRMVEQFIATPSGYMPTPLEPLCQKLFDLDTSDWRDMVLLISYRVDGQDYKICFDNKEPEPNYLVTFPPICGPIEPLLDNPRIDEAWIRFVDKHTQEVKTKDVSHVICQYAGPLGDFYYMLPRHKTKMEWIRAEIGPEADWEGTVLFLGDTDDHVYRYRLDEAHLIWEGSGDRHRVDLNYSS